MERILAASLGMPHMDGYESIRRVRALPPERGGTAPAIALTAYAGAEDRTRAVAAGYDLHLARPCTPGDLVAAPDFLAGSQAGT
jgi:CheY-like chemotaxis protein